MESQLDLDYCPQCDLPTFNHEMVAMVNGNFFHLHCFNGTKFVAKMATLKGETN